MKRRPLEDTAHQTKKFEKPNLKSIVKGHLGGSLAKRLPSAQVMILGSWDRASHWAPYSAESLLLPLPLPLSPLMLSLSLSQINK